MGGAQVTPAAGAFDAHSPGAANQNTAGGAAPPPGAAEGRAVLYLSDSSDSGDSSEDLDSQEGDANESDEDDGWVHRMAEKSGVQLDPVEVADIEAVMKEHVKAFCEIVLSHAVQRAEGFDGRHIHSADIAHGITQTLYRGHGMYGLADAMAAHDVQRSEREAAAAAAPAPAEGGGEDDEPVKELKCVRLRVPVFFSPLPNEARHAGSRARWRSTSCRSRSATLFV